MIHAVGVCSATRSNKCLLLSCNVNNIAIFCSQIVRIIIVLQHAMTSSAVTHALQADNNRTARNVGGLRKDDDKINIRLV